MLKQFMQLLSSDIQNEQPLAPNEDGSYSLQLEPALNVIFRETAGEAIMLYTALASMPKKKTEEFLLLAMSANLFGRETGGSALGLDSEAKKVVLLNFLPKSINYNDFHDALEDFVNYADVWSVEIANFIETKSGE
jgi:hypothetical protein